MAEEISLEMYKKAYREVMKEEAKRGFLIHFVVYVLVNAGLATANIIYAPGTIWFHFPLIFWGIGISAHYLFGVHWLEKWLEEHEALAEYRVRKAGRKQ